MGDEGTSYQIDLPVHGADKVDAAAKSLEVLAARVAEQKEAYSQAEKAASSVTRAVERLSVAAEAQRGKIALATALGDTKGVEKAAITLKVLEDRQAATAKKAEEMKAALLRQAAALDAASAAHTAEVATLDAAAKAEKALAAAKDQETKATKAAAEAEAKQAAVLVAAQEKEAKASKAAAEAEAKQSKGVQASLSHFEGLDRSLRKIGGPLAETVGGVARLGEAFAKLGARLGTAGLILAAAAAVVALTVAFAAGPPVIAAWGVHLADANRSAELLAQGIAHDVAGGELLSGKLDALTRTLPLTREELSGMAEKLSEAGYRGAALSATLETTATRAAKLKFGPNFAAEMLSLGQQSKVFQANLAGVFGGLKIDGLLSGLQKMVALFDESTESGKTIKVVFESLFQPLVDGVAGSAVKVERFFLQFENYTLEGLIWLKGVTHWFDTTLPEALKKWEPAIIAAAAFVTTLFAPAIWAAITATATWAITTIPAAIVATVAWAASMASAAVATLAATWPLLLIAAAVALVAVGIYELVKHWDAVKAAFASAGQWAADVAGAIVDGLVQGIEKGGAAILSAMKGAVLGAVEGVKHLLGIASPSKVFADIGMQTGAGMSLGVDRSSGGVQNSLEAMVSPPSSNAGKPAPAAPAAAASGRGGASISGNTFVLQGVQGAEDAEKRIGALLTRLLEGDVAQLGAAVPG